LRRYRLTVVISKSVSIFGFLCTVILILEYVTGLYSAETKRG
jgi:hypothetical protein